MSRCWAINAHSLVRCDQDAGHNGNHSIITDWTDDECWDGPGSPVQLTAIAIPDPEIPSPPAPHVHEEPIAGVCFVCKHAHRGGPCKCGCEGFIE